MTRRLVRIGVNCWEYLDYLIADGPCAPLLPSIHLRLGTFLQRQHVAGQVE